MLSIGSPVHAILRSDRIPSCPVVMVSVIKALQDPGTSVSELARAIGADAILTAKLLQLVNSAFYGLPRSVHSVEEAAIRLGFRELWAIAVAAQMRQVYRHINAAWRNEMNVLWEHSLRTAILARAIARLSRRTDPEDAFTSGILHDLGKMALMSYFEEGTQDLYKEGGPLGAHLERTEREQWGAGHAELGGGLLRRWGLPEGVAVVVERHHESNRIAHPGLAVLCVADALAHSCCADGEGSLYERALAGVLASGAEFEAAGLDESACGWIAAEADHKFDEFMRAFN